MYRTGEPAACEREPADYAHTHIHRHRLSLLFTSSLSPLRWGQAGLGNKCHALCRRRLLAVSYIHTPLPGSVAQIANNKRFPRYLRVFRIARAACIVNASRAVLLCPSCTATILRLGESLLDAVYLGSSTQHDKLFDKISPLGTQRFLESETIPFKPWFFPFLASPFFFVFFFFPLGDSRCRKIISTVRTRYLSYGNRVDCCERELHCPGLRPFKLELSLLQTRR